MKSKLLILSLVILSLISGIYLWHINHDSLHLKRVSYRHLPGWDDANTIKSLGAFKVSCEKFIKQRADAPVGSPYIDLTAKDWYPACRAALLLDPTSKDQAKQFFEHWFTPVEFYNRKPIEGLFTGYYVPLLRGSLTQTKKYKVPIYQTPSNLITIDLGLFDPTLKNRQLIGRQEANKIVPFYTREEISRGAISNTATVIAWVDSHLDRLFMEIQGSGTIEFEDGSHLVVGYASQNGAPYTAIGSVLIKQGVMTKENMSMQSIRDYLESHPEQIDTVINQNKSFVFFEKLPHGAVVGTKGIVLTPKYSLAVDRRWVPLGVPIWLNTTRPDVQSNAQKTLQRLMVAQDTGGAIRGQVRGDVFWGTGDRATTIAGKMKNHGFYWLLLPKEVAKRLT